MVVTTPFLEHNKPSQEIGKLPPPISNKNYNKKNNFFFFYKNLNYASNTKHGTQDGNYSVS